MSTSVCASCSVMRGECPECGTFWFYQGTKRYGVRPTEQVVPRSGVWNGHRNTGPMVLDEIANLVVR